MLETLYLSFLRLTQTPAFSLIPLSVINGINRLGTVLSAGDLTVSKTDTDPINAHYRREDRFTTNCVVRLAISAPRKT